VSDLRTYARALRGEVSGGQVLFPGPGHSPKDRSCSLRISPAAPDGFLVFSHCGDDFRDVRDHVRNLLGLDKFGSRIPVAKSPSAPIAQPAVATEDDAAKIARSRRLWSEGVDPRGTLVEKYLASRLLALSDDIAGSVLRFHSAVPWLESDDVIIRVPAMLAVYRDIRSDEICGVQVTRLSSDGAKIDRKMRGRCGNGAIKLDADAHVMSGLVVGEGCETAMTARQVGLRPAWALGSKGKIGTFPVLAGIEALTLLREHSETPRGRADVAKVIEACASRWHAAGCEVEIVEPLAGSDLNDAIQEFAL
jgi:putative DNA primase/helicase